MNAGKDTHQADRQQRKNESAREARIREQNPGANGLTATRDNVTT